MLIYEPKGDRAGMSFCSIPKSAFTKRLICRKCSTKVHPLRCIYA